VLALIFVLVGLIGTLYLLQADQVTVTHYQIMELRARLEELERENSALMLAIARQTSEEHLEEQAKALGYGPPASVEYLVVAPLPSKAALAEKPLEIARPRSLMAQFQDWMNFDFMAVQSQWNENGVTP